MICLCNISSAFHNCANWMSHIQRCRVRTLCSIELVYLCSRLGRRRVDDDLIRPAQAGSIVAMRAEGHYGRGCVCLSMVAVLRVFVSRGGGYEVRLDSRCGSLVHILLTRHQGSCCYLRHACYEACAYRRRPSPLKVKRRHWRQFNRAS